MSAFQNPARSAAAAIRAITPTTLLQCNEHLCERYDANILLKREDLSPVRSYKLRGAFNAMRNALKAKPK